MGESLAGERRWFPILQTLELRIPESLFLKFPSPKFRPQKFLISGLPTP
jgi:hypothetical protein